eukprot:GHVU01071183.1.p1 GENE.GHVU01071183.1~~GHVU01071183.1.p1  ORF type:complete len:579 (+),score=71.69 GHVU01071183.1:79-1815(+)
MEVAFDEIHVCHLGRGSGVVLGGSRNRIFLFGGLPILKGQYDSFWGLSDDWRKNWKYIVELLLFIPPIFASSIWSLGVFWPFGLARCGKERANSPSKLPMHAPILNQGTLCLRACTKGNNPTLVRSVTKQNIELLKLAEVPDWKVEIVTDNPMHLKDEFDDDSCRVDEIVVPNSFVPENGAVFKARALHYANQPGVSSLCDDDLIIHLDEETTLDLSSITGILDFWSKHPDRIGQGTIVYGRQQIVNPITTMADSIRVADDYLRFRMTFTLGYAFQGMHGSYVVIRAGREREVSFDHTPKGSITEDATFALVALQKGIKFSFVQGLMMEKSPFTLVDFFKQRRRWFQGLWMTISLPHIRFHAKILLVLSLLSWSMFPFAAAMAYAWYVFFPLRLTPVVSVLRPYIMGTATWVYGFGSAINFSWKACGWWYPVYVVATPMLTPLWAVLEGGSVVYSIFTPFKIGFHVVTKETDAMRRAEGDRGASGAVTAEEEAEAGGAGRARRTAAATSAGGGGADGANDEVLIPLRDLEWEGGRSKLSEGESTGVRSDVADSPATTRASTPSNTMRDGESTMSPVER